MTNSGEPNCPASASSRSGSWGEGRRRSVFNPWSPSLQQRIDEREQPIKRAAVGIEHGTPGGTHDRAEVGVGKEPLYRVGELAGVGDDDRRAGVHEELRDFLAVEVVRPRQYRAPDRGRLEQVVAADRGQAAGHE